MEKTRVFFKRKATRLLQSYWCARWDNLPLRQLLSLNYNPKYYLESEHLDGLYIKLKNLDFLWYKGLFTLGKHLPSGRYYRDPVHLPVRGLGPRECVFPATILTQLGQLTLLGDWTRYQYSAENWLKHDEQPIKISRRRTPEERLCICVDKLSVGLPPPIIGWWKLLRSTSPTVCLEGRILNSPLFGQYLKIPIDEIYWNLLGSL